jgi:hypothetical protein
MTCVAANHASESVKNGVFDDPAIPQMFDDDALQQGRRHTGVPDTVRIDDNDRTATTNAEARRLTAFDAGRTEQESFPLQERGQQTIELTTAMIGRAKAADADQHMT